ncbi:MAG: FHA domain-containing protein [Gloeocapsa sp. DLM2.Bin57]|nr:MAG: FHA domain-containing protein [Gloeocapsa sp. DLM2.Bin57]
MENSALDHVLVVEREGSSTVFMLNNESFSIGRHSSNSLVIKSRVISRCHATILPIKSYDEEVTSFWIIDGNEQGIVSTNGFTVNSEPCLMHQLKPGDQIDFPDGTKITYQVKDRFEEEDNSDDLAPTGNLLQPDKQPVNNQLPVKTTYADFFPSSRLDTRIYVQNINMLCLLLEKELEMVRAKNTILSLIFIYYNSKKMQQISPKSYNKILRLYQLIVNQKITNPYDFILSFNDLEIAVLHNCNQKQVAELAQNIAIDIYMTSKKINFSETENVITGAYSQVPQTERNGKVLIERVNQLLTEKTDGNLFINLNLLRI